MLAVEFLDEFAFGVSGAAWPLIRTDLGLSYVQVGLLLSVPMIIGHVVEPAIGILGDVWKRRLLILSGGVFFTLSLALVATSTNFLFILAAFILFNPSSGAFVSLSQASLMDSDPRRHEQNMARWTFAGSLGVVLGSLALGLAVTIGLGWRGMFLLTVALAIFALLMVSRIPLGNAARVPGSSGRRLRLLKEGMADALRALRRRSVLRWLVLLEFSDLMLDVLNGYLALYIVDVARGSEAQAALAVGVWAGVGLIGDFLLIPLLERVRGLTYLRYSILTELVLFPAFLLVPGLGLKLAILGLLGFANAGWYSVLKGQLYTSMPGQSGTVMAVGSVSGLVGSLMPLGLGALAGLWGLGSVMWLLLAGPVALLIGIPHVREHASSSR